MLSVILFKIQNPTFTLYNKSLLRPIWSYGAQKWGCDKQSLLKTIEAFQSTSLRIIHGIHQILPYTNTYSLYIESVENLVKTHYKKYYTKLLMHHDPLIAQQHTVTIHDNPSRRFKRLWCRDL